MGSKTNDGNIWVKFYMARKRKITNPTQALEMNLNIRKRIFCKKNVWNFILTFKLDYGTIHKRRFVSQIDHSILASGIFIHNTLCNTKS